MNSSDQENLYYWYQRYKNHDLEDCCEDWLKVLRSSLIIPQDRSLLEQEDCKLTDEPNASPNFKEDTSLLIHSSFMFFDKESVKSFNQIGYKPGRIICKRPTSTSFPISENKTTEIALSLGVQPSDSASSWASLLTPVKAGEKLVENKNASVSEDIEPQPKNSLRKEILVKSIFNADASSTEDLLNKNFEKNVLHVRNDQNIASKEACCFDHVNISLPEMFGNSRSLSIYSSTPILEKVRRKTMREINLPPLREGDSSENENDHHYLPLQPACKPEEDCHLMTRNNSPVHQVNKSETNTKVVNVSSADSDFTSFMYGNSKSEDVCSNGCSPLDKMNNNKATNFSLVKRTTCQKFIYPLFEEKLISQQIMSTPNLFKTLAGRLEPVEEKSKVNINEVEEIICQQQRSFLKACSLPSTVFEKENMKTSTNLAKESVSVVHSPFISKCACKSGPSSNASSSLLPHECSLKKDLAKDDTHEHVATIKSCIENFGIVASKSFSMPNINKPEAGEYQRKTNVDECPNNEQFLPKLGRNPDNYTKREYIRNESSTFQGFSTASGEKIKVSDDALCRGQILWKEVNDLQTHKASGNCKTHASSVGQAPNCGKGEMMGSSDSFHKLCSLPTNGAYNVDNLIKFSDFNEDGARRLHPDFGNSTKVCGLKKSKVFTENIKGQNKLENEATDIAYSESENFNIKGNNKIPSFKTASNKKIDINPRFLLKAKCLLEQTENFEASAVLPSRNTSTSLNLDKSLEVKNFNKTSEKSASPILGSQKHKRKYDYTKSLVENLKHYRETKILRQDRKGPEKCITSLLLGEENEYLNSPPKSKKIPFSAVMQSKSGSFNNIYYSDTVAVMRESPENLLGISSCDENLENCSVMEHESQEAYSLMKRLGNSAKKKTCNSQETMEIDKITEAFLLDTSWDNNISSEKLASTTEIVLQL